VQQLHALGEVTALLDRNGIEYWLFGGWAVDFHVGRVTRAHDDVDLAVWLEDEKRVASLLHANGWQHAPEPDEDGGTGYERDGVRLELTRLVSDGAGRVLIPLRAGSVVFSEEPLGNDARELQGMSARIIPLTLLRDGKSRPRDDREDAAKDRADYDVLSPIQVRLLGADELAEHLDALAEVLEDCVAGGASVSYMWPFSHEQARAAFEGFAADAADGRRLILGAFDGDRLVGTVQVNLALPPNQPHRGEIAKLLVHRSARGRRIAERLMEQAEAEARAEGKTLLVLDTVTGSTAERLYERLGWTRIGVVPDFALYPDGRPCDATIFWKRLDQS
jgi:GNAT superfamily N-acetyltransferase